MQAFNIAYIVTPIEFGGSEKVSLNFLRNVNRDKFNIYPILLIRPWEKENIFIRELEKENYKIQKIPVALRAPNEGKDYFRVFRCFWMIYSILLKGSFDLIHTHGYFADIVGIPAAKKLHIPIVSTCHGYISNNKTLRIYNILDRFCLRFSDKIISVSETIKNNLVRSGFVNSRIRVILNAVQTDLDQTNWPQARKKKRLLFKIDDKELVIGYVGRLSEEKGVKYLIEACSLINQSGVPIKLLILGEGPHKKELADLVEIKGLRHLVYFIGFQSDIENWMPALDIFCLPSLTEGTPMALLEAMAYGIPVVASGVGGVPEIIRSGTNGILVSPGNPEEIKKSIQTLYENRTLSARLSLAGRETVSANYNVRKWCLRIEQEYLNIIKNSESGKK